MPTRVREPNGMRKSGSREKNAAVPVSLMSLLPAAPVSAGRKEEKWFPQKTCNDSRRSDLLAFLGN